MKNNNQAYTAQFYSSHQAAEQNQGQQGQQSQSSSNSQESQASSGNKNTTGPDSKVELPKGGGAIKGIGEKFQANPLTGTASISAPIAMSPGRSGFSPQLGLSYDSGSGNSPYGLGWNIGLPSITRKTDKGIPKYLDTTEYSNQEDTFILSGAEDLVVKRNTAGQVIPPMSKQIATVDYLVQTYIPRIEGLFAKIEKWVKESDGDIHWRATTKDNTTTVYGQSPEARIANAQDDKKVFQWLIERSSDNKGNIIHYEYKQENSENISNELYEKNRLANGNAFTKKYLKKVYYANTNRLGLDDTFTDVDFLMQLVLDYGEHDLEFPSPLEDDDWNLRLDPFSTFKSGFEIRTYRLCKRILMFHQFEELGTDWTLVKSTDLKHQTDDWAEGDDIPALTLLESVTHTGYRDGNFKSYPPLVFKYSEANSPNKIHSFDEKDLQNIPTAVDANNHYQWIDLYNEGLSGVLIKQDQAWYYKPNLGDEKYHNESLEESKARLGALRKLDNKPSVANTSNGFSFGDLDGNGKTDIAIHSGPVSGFQELDEKDEWGHFTYFKSLPNINWQDPNLKMLDLNGDGHADILITENHCFSCYYSLAKEGYTEAQRLSKEMDENLGPNLVFNDLKNLVFTADMSGDGLTDIVRINNGAIDYWPNMGYGRFGAKVSMKNAPRFDYADMFDPGRIRLADIDGSGTTDILYVGRKTMAYYNLAGNAWSAAEEIKLMPPVDSASTVTVMDLMGKGTSCIVWSTTLPYSNSNRMQYMELTGGEKPFLLQEMNNNMGGVRKFQYAPSTKFYLKDKKADNDWITKLSFPVQVLEKTLTIDELTESVYTNKYAYHHGYFDGQEREFRGFGMVEQWDSDDYEVSITDEFENINQGPVYTKTWFHTGFYQQEKAISQQYMSEYFDGDEQAWFFDDTILPEDLSAAEIPQACRALKGSVLRREVYAKDGSEVEHLPYTVEEKSYHINRLQEKADSKFAVFLVTENETISYQYERNTSDPRVMHKIVLENDDYGNILRQSQISYPRRAIDALEEQKELLVSYQKNSFINSPSASFYRLSVPYQEQAFQIYGFSNSSSTKLTAEDFTNAETWTTLNYEQENIGDEKQKRMLSHSKQLFYTEDLSSSLSLGNIASHGLPYQSYKLAYTNGLLDNLCLLNEDGENLHNNLLSKADLEEELLNRGQFIEINGDYWQQGDIQEFAPANFYLPFKITDAFGNSSSMQYDDYGLFLEKVSDALGNETHILNDYCALQPIEIIDANLNHSQVAFDALGMVTATAIKGKELSLGVWEGDSIDAPTVSMDYDLDQWKLHQKPVFVHTQARETHQDAETNWLHSYTYSDGLGRELQTKVQAEDGKAWYINEQGIPDEENDCSTRWTSTGRSIYNNKGKVVKQYEPWFSNTHKYVSETLLNEFGQTPVMYYDPLGRVYHTQLPDRSFTRVEFSPWHQENWDNNDTLLDKDEDDQYICQWYTERVIETTDHPEKETAVQAALHAGTPQIQHFDNLGRMFLTVDDNGTEGQYQVRQKLNIQGQPMVVKDAKGRDMTTNSYNLLGEPIYTYNIDSGRRWQLTDVAQKPMAQWNNRQHKTINAYDELQRPISVSLHSDGAIQKVEKTVYGSMSSNNTNGQIIELYDQSGKKTIPSYDFKGNMLYLNHQMSIDYKNILNWNTSPDLSSEIFSQSFVYDAMNRPVELSKPDDTIEQFTYNKAGLLETVKAMVKGEDGVFAVTNINYNEKGQRTGIYYGNGSKTRYDYDEETFRLKRMLTTRNMGSDILLDLNYIYDPVGNITEVDDPAQETIYYNNSEIKAKGKYSYDALYRLKTATGRELRSLQLPNQSDFANNIGFSSPEANSMQNYTQQFQYDELGNLIQMKSVDEWTRDYFYDFVEDNYLLGHTEDLIEYEYDEHGNLTQMPHLSQIDWSYKDELLNAILNASGDTAYYVYDAGGERVRKVIEKTGGIVEERIYLGGYEIFRKSVSGVLGFERETLHVSDNEKKIVSIETKTKENATSIQNPVPSIRYQYDNHLGSSTLELDHSAALISYEEYHPFGTTSYRSGSTENEVSMKRYKYVGKERDDETGLYYYGARYYAAWLCRFVSVDPLATERQWLNPYNYVQNNPINRVDPTGALDEDPPKGKGSISSSIKTDTQVENIIDHDNKTINHTSTSQSYFGDELTASNRVNFKISQNSEGTYDISGYASSLEYTDGKITGIHSERFSYDNVSDLSQLDDGFSAYVSNTLSEAMPGLINGNITMSDRFSFLHSKAMDYIGLGLSVGATGATTASTLGNLSNKLSLLDEGKFLGNYKGASNTWSLGFKGNQHVSSTLVTAEKSKFLNNVKVLQGVKAGGYILGGLGVGISAAQFATTNDPGKMFEYGFDVAMGLVGFAGLPGAAVSGLFFATKPLQKQNAKHINKAQSGMSDLGKGFHAIQLAPFK